MRINKILQIFSLLILCITFPINAQSALELEIEDKNIITNTDNLTRVTICHGNIASLFYVELADSKESRAIGLMFRKHLPDNQGMLFDFIEEQQPVMWMKNTHISLDMLFIDRNGTIQHIVTETTPHSLKQIPSPIPVRFVLELSGGISNKLNITAGDKIIITPKEPTVADIADCSDVLKQL